MNIIAYFLPSDIAWPGAVLRATGRGLLLVVICATGIASQAQQKKGALQLADQYFAAGEYYTAANLYEQFLHPPRNQKSSTGFPLNSKVKNPTAATSNVSLSKILYKQAESYRLANYWQQAATTYKKCFDESPSEYADAIYWHAVCERSLGHYDTAKASIEQYLSSGGDHTQYKDAAQKELQTLLYISQQLSRADSILFKTKKLEAPNSTEKGMYAMAHANGDEFLITSTEKNSGQLSGTNPYQSRLFYTSLTNKGLDKLTPVNVASADAQMNQGAGTLSVNGKFLYFSEWKKDNGKTVSSIYYSVKQAGNWSTPAILAGANVDGYNSKQPFCTTDGKYLLFTSDRPGGNGKFDIWYAPIKKDGTVGDAVNLGPSINTADDEQAPFYHNSSGTLVFSSNRSGMGGYDLFSAKGSETTWTSPENMGYPVNSARDDIYFFAAEKSPLLSNAILSSDRGNGCCLETYNVTKAPKKKRLLGVLHDCQDNTPVANAEVTLRDPSGTSSKVVTNDKGEFSFELGAEPGENLALVIEKLLYKPTSTPLQVQSMDESDLLLDKWIASDLCIEKKPAPKALDKLVIKAENVVTVYFDFDKSNLKDDASAKLDSIYNILQQDPALTIEISGYTDGIGTDAYNKVLSDKRARACANYLVQKGIESSRVNFVSFGACCPVEMEKINGRDNPDGRKRNRRALINIDRQ